MKNKKEAEKAKNKPEKLERIFPINIKKLKIGKIEKKPFPKYIIAPNGKKIKLGEEK
jgi:hypothetical protein